LVDTEVFPTPFTTTAGAPSGQAVSRGDKWH
jgi:hypothetical protein